MAILGPPKGYVDLLDEATTAKLTKDREDGSDYQKTPIRPSAAGECTRSLYYQLNEFSGRAKYDTDIIEPSTHRIFGLGHSVEYHLIKQFDVLSDFVDIRYKQQVLSFAKLEAKHDPKLGQWLEGSLDLTLWSEKYKCVADVKSKKDKFSQGFKSNWDETSEKLARMKTVERISDSAFWVEDLEAFLHELNDPFFEMNFWQLNLYASADFLKERNVDHAAIIQYNKNDSRLREVRFKPSDAMAKRTIAKMQSVITAVDEANPELAPRDHTLGSVKCAFCRFQKECWQKDAKQAFYKTLPFRPFPRDTSHLGEVGEKLEELFESYQQQEQAEKAKHATEAEILKLMLNSKVKRIRLPNRDIFEIRELTNGLVIRRSK